MKYDMKINWKYKCCSFWSVYGLIAGLISFVFIWFLIFSVSLQSVGLLGAGGVIMGRCTANPAPPSTAGRPLTGIKFQFARPTPRHPPTSPIQQPSTNLTIFHSFLHDKWRQNNCQKVKESHAVFGDQFEDNNHYWLNYFLSEWLKKLFFTVLYRVEKKVNIFMPFMPSVMYQICQIVCSTWYH